MKTRPKSSGGIHRRPVSAEKKTSRKVASTTRLIKQSRGALKSNRPTENRPRPSGPRSRSPLRRKHPDASRSRPSPKRRRSFSPPYSGSAGKLSGPPLDRAVGARRENIVERRRASHSPVAQKRASSHLSAQRSGKDLAHSSRGDVSRVKDRNFRGVDEKHNFGHLDHRRERGKNFQRRSSSYSRELEQRQKTVRSFSGDRREIESHGTRDIDERHDVSAYHQKDIYSSGTTSQRKGFDTNQGYGRIDSAVGIYSRESGGMDSRGYHSTEQRSSNTTLSERFRSINNETSRNLEPRMVYTQEDLEKITVGIHRNVREPSPTVRCIVNPDEVRFARRPEEGSRPIFDREEIKLAAVDLRDDAYFERRVVAVVKSEEKHASSPKKERLPSKGNIYEKSRPNYQTYRYGNNGNSVPMHNERWQDHSVRRGDSSFNVDRDVLREREGTHSYDRERSGDYYGSSDLRQPISMDPFGGNQDSERRFLSERELHRGRDIGGPRPEDFGRNQGPPPFCQVPTDLRSNISGRRKDNSSTTDARQRILERRGEQLGKRESRSKQRSYESERKNLDISSGRFREERGAFVGSRGPMHSRYHNRERSPKDKLPNFSQRPDRFKVQPWMEKPDSTPKEPSYFEHDDRGESSRGRFRGVGRGFRSLGIRGRFFRGGFRGSLRGRGGFRGRIFRGRGFLSKRGRGSPSHWEHDMFHKMSPEEKNA
ncbi:zinc finger CCCH domain-containing protein 13-like isoform X2 [Limulus polyphemus]|uniref:Zinc finger CCCH domain-containing protein 13-like isoform X2 n=1 Tax=Limulus polyphemus TaxID=6850 RepID=A0ABM1B5C0_LIMPO|nr:zinc finger CCCH domain-containing protein 13-like isoform X2 [Limulus polyphemus]